MSHVIYHHRESSVLRATPGMKHTLINSHACLALHNLSKAAHSKPRSPTRVPLPAPKSWKGPPHKQFCRFLTRASEERVSLGSLFDGREVTVDFEAETAANMQGIGATALVS